MMNGPMLQVLLKDRFKLKVHRQTREVPVFALTVAKTGPKLKPFQKGTCMPVDYAQDPPPRAPGQPPFCQTRIRSKATNVRILDIPAATLAAFSQILGNVLGRPVVDRTGINGEFDFHLEFAIGQSTPGFAPDAAPGDATGGTSIFTAITEQLGLKLTSSKGPGQVLIIDRVERPSEN